MNKGKDFLNDALFIKINQAEIMANELCKKYENIIDVDWTNTKSRFKSFCNKEHNNNPADIVLKFNDEGTSNSFLGVSLKASFGKTDIGQYNSSICSFISGLMIKKDQENYGVYSNNRIELECKSNCELVGNEIQDLCNAYKDEFYNKISTIDSKLEIFKTDDKSKRDLKSAAYKDFMENLSEDITNEVVRHRINLLRKCRDYYFHRFFNKGKDKEKISIPYSVAQIIFANYLRIDIGNSGNDDTIPYIKGSVLDGKAVIDGDNIEENSNKVEEQLKMINYYMPYPYRNSIEEDYVEINYESVASGSILIYCTGAEKGIICRIKFGGTPPSSFKIDGKNFNVNNISSIISKAQKGKQGGGGITLFQHLTGSNGATNLALLYEALDQYLHNTDNIDDIKNKLEEIKEIDDIRNIFTNFRDSRLGRVTLRHLVTEEDSSYEEFWFDWMNIMNLYIDERNSNIVEEMLKPEENLLSCVGYGMLENSAYGIAAATAAQYVPYLSENVPGLVRSVASTGVSDFLISHPYGSAAALAGSVGAMMAYRNQRLPFISDRVIPSYMRGGANTKKRKTKKKVKSKRKTKKNIRRKTKRNNVKKGKLIKLCKGECNKTKKVLPLILKKMGLSKEEITKKIKEHDENCVGNCFKLIQDEDLIKKLMKK